MAPKQFGPVSEEKSKSSKKQGEKETKLSKKQPPSESETPVALISGVSGESMKILGRQEGFLYHWEPLPPRILLKPAAVARVIIPPFSGVYRMFSFNKSLIQNLFLQCHAIFHNYF